jgi:hypothetical protein
MAEAETLAFKTGYLIACCNVVNLHDQPGIAYDVLAEAGITTADVKAMDLSEYDAKALRIIRKERPSKGDPIEPAKKRRPTPITTEGGGENG